ncbi:CP family cyanate transporter-like MFS transporter [Microbacterium sp. SLBN-154]|uniref:MFS transporter n=1 Tax=Microbacterium sp. SLBN-154 TaxID=2768458 RepID=UPI0011542630|nr:MFS transporter [Microbacterium sp. SLBN-154]TQK18292.1 CP family cyanate transporter-like MFS transporter [Microbacterium sp. SLBN-154]
MTSPARATARRTSRTTARTVILVLAVCLVAANMRPTITALGPVLDQIGADTGLSLAVLGVLAAVPLAAWALFSPLAHEVARRFGLGGAILGSLVLLLAGAVVRSLPGPVALLWIGTALIGMALAAVNVLMPAVVKRDFPARVPLMMAVYTALLGGFGALASGVVVPLSHLSTAGGELGWRWALVLVGGVLIPPAIAGWAAASRRKSADATARPPRRSTGIWRDRVAWLVAAYMGLQSAMFYMSVTWFAAISVSTGRSEVAAGVDVMLYQLFSTAGALVLPLLLRGRVERWAPAAVPVLAVVGTIGLMAAPDLITGWVVLIGLSSGASLGMSLTLMAVRARDHVASSALSGMAQSVGYLVAATGPIVFGALYSATGSWLWPLGLLLLVLVGQSAVGVFAGRPRFVLR